MTFSRNASNIEIVKILQRIADICICENEKSVFSTSVKKESVAETKKQVAKEQAGTIECVDTKARVALSRLLTILTDNDTLKADEVEEIEDILDDKVEVALSEDYKPSSASPYSDDEIDRMFNFEK